MDDAAFDAFFGPRKSKTPEEIAREDALEDDIPGWPTPEYVRERLEELSAMPPSPDVTAEKLWLARPDEDLTQLATAHLAMRAFMGPSLTDREAETQKAKAEVATLKPKAKAFDEREVEQHESHRHMIEKVVEGTAKYRDIWTNKLIECIQGKGKRSFRVDETWTQLEAATALHSAARWPDGTDGTDEKWDEKDPYWRHRPPTVRMIKRRISHLELNTGKALYRHKPGSKHTRCDFCPPRS